MRLFPPELEINSEEGFTREKDIFSRKEFGDRLTRIVRVLDGPAVLVLDAPWGNGKTTFIKMWQGELSRAGDPTVYFDAFKSDYHEDAFLALAGEIIARAEQTKPRNTKALKDFKKRAVRVAKVLGRASLHVGTRLGTAGLLSATDIEGAAKDVAMAVSEEADKGLDELLKKRLESHKEDRDAFEQFGTALRELAGALAGESKEGKPAPSLVFIIDELACLIHDGSDFGLADVA